MYEISAIFPLFPSRPRVQINIQTDGVARHQLSSFSPFLFFWQCRFRLVRAHETFSSTLVLFLSLRSLHGRAWDTQYASVEAVNNLDKPKKSKWNKLFYAIYRFVFSGYTEHDIHGGSVCLSCIDFAGTLYSVLCALCSVHWNRKRFARKGIFHARKTLSSFVHLPSAANRRRQPPSSCGHPKNQKRSINKM